MHANPNLAFLSGGGEMGKRMREMDWAATPFGPVETWSPSLKMTVSLLLANGQPIIMWWGPEYLCLYNDAYIPVLGAKHSWALGRPVREVWSEIRDILKPLIDAPFTGTPTSIDDIRLDLKRHGFLEETHFTVVYSPVPDPTAPNGIGGVIAPVHEITGKVLGERRALVLRQLGQRLADSRTAEGACEIAAETLAEDRDDLPFALLYLASESGDQARLVGATGLADDASLRPPVVDLKQEPATWRLNEAAQSQAMVLVERSPAGPAAILPIRSTKANELAGFLVVGVSPLLRFDDLYRSFLDLAAAQVATAIANARAYEEERRKAEALAEIDRVKTAFFSNVSHEFRTPLTLMLGPIEATLANSTLPDADREQIELAHRSSQRLLKLVNSLLDFSRIEAGRVQASYAPIDLAAATADLASVFRSTVERAGMKLTVDCLPLGESVFVDGEMWEKIVLNLISNAFKFTFDGEIEVSVRRVGSEARLTVGDTGTGIPANEIPRLFERFHRINGAAGRSYEGSGIGLALVQELAQLHGGRVEVESEVGRGSRFHVFIPFGKAHLPADRIAESATLWAGGLRAVPYLEEMKRWLPSALGDADPDNLPPDGEAFHPSVFPDLRRVLLADDNADMRDYLKRILEQAGYVVEAVADGEAALRVAGAWKPDLVLTDAMMPRLDGFGLLRALRADPQLAAVPIVLLSARAGEEARIEGMQAGADDYVVKPFGARELLARVQGSLSLARVRQEAEAAVRKSEERLRALVNASTYAVYRMSADWTEMLELRGQGFVVDIEAPSTSWLESYIHPDDRAAVTAAIRQAIDSKSMFELEHRVLRVDGTPGWTLSRAVPLFDAAGEVVEWFGAASDVTHRVQGEMTRKLLLRELDHRVKNTLATVQAIAHQTLRHTRVPSDFAPRFSSRIEALARVHGLLTKESWRGTSLRLLLREQLLQGPVDDSRLEMSGPEIHLDPQVTLHLGLMMHELGTNCVKYGAWSVAGGRVRITWTLEGDTLRLRWVERGGPAVTGPRSRGFGTTLIEQSSKGLGGDARAIFDAEGLTWDINLPLPSTAAASADKGNDELAASPSVRVDAPATRPLAGQRILVLEDEPLVTMMVEQVLGEAGATVVAVSSEEEALSAIRARHFDKAALDVNIHGRQVRDVPAALMRLGVPFLFVTGYGRAALPAGFEQAATLNKPFNNQKLVDSLSALGRDAEAARAV
jgi:signal transduction histidine kinase/DNA-binding response OmpR family regulator